MFVFLIQLINDMLLFLIKVIFFVFIVFMLTVCTMLLEQDRKRRVFTCVGKEPIYEKKDHYRDKHTHGQQQVKIK